MTTNDGGPAFPQAIEDNPGGPHVIYTPGMSLRDWFAGQALAGYVSSQTILNSIRGVAESDGVKTNAFLAGLCYEAADAMLAAREASK